jgi:hypothetical protein
VQDLHQDAARRDQHERAERRVAHDPERDLHARRRHRRHRDLRAEPVRQVPVRLPELLDLADPDPNPANVGLVQDAGHRRLDRDGIADPVGRPLRLVERPGRERVDDRDVVRGQQAQRRDLREDGGLGEPSAPLGFDPR